MKIYFIDIKNYCKIKFKLVEEYFMNIILKYNYTKLTYILYHFIFLNNLNFTGKFYDRSTS